MIRSTLRKLYWWAEGHKAQLMGTKYHERSWKKRHHSGELDWDGGEGDFFANYWASRQHPHRTVLVERIKAFSPQSVLEFGSNCGPNLSLLRAEDREISITGIDISAAAIDAGRRLLGAEEGETPRLLVGGVESLSEFSDDQFDVVFTDAVLLYVAKDQLSHFAREAVRIARKGLILLEWHDETLRRDRFFKGCWVRNYRRLFDGLVSESAVHISPLPPKVWPSPHWERFGTVVEVRKSYSASDRRCAGVAEVSP